MRKYLLSLLTGIITFGLLSIVHLKSKVVMLAAERFFKGSGWIEITLLSIYAGFLLYKMTDKRQVAKWRKISWMVFSVVFFGQLILGILADERFLLSGKLHLPVPAMILSGPLYRMEISFMSVLFLSTIVLTGPAWCSHLCYFGALDNLSSSGKGLRNIPLKKKFRSKFLVLILVIISTIFLRAFNIELIYAALSGILFGLTGIIIIIFISRKKNKMVHCVSYCPIGTITSYLKYISPFRMSIQTNCTTCMACTLKCNYDALNLENIKKKKPGITCTYCGDCLSSCHEKAIRYHFFRFKPETARNLYLIITISIHAVFMELGII